MHSYRYSMIKKNITTRKLWKLTLDGFEYRKKTKCRFEVSVNRIFVEEMGNNELSIPRSSLWSLHLALYLFMKQIVLDQICSQYMLGIVDNKQFNKNRQLNLPIWLVPYNYIFFLSLNFWLLGLYMVYTQMPVIMHRLLISYNQLLIPFSHLA